jgi:pimeloyl-ACP methyl ester carboxylesterase
MKKTIVFWILVGLFFVSADQIRTQTKSAVKQKNESLFERAAENPKMRLAGRHDFQIKPEKNEEIFWQLSREETDETGGGEARKFENIARAKGDSVSFDLPKIAGKETVYIVRANRKNSTQIQRIQVFEPNARASFIFKSDGNPDVRVSVAVPPTLSARTKILLVMSGRQRNADEYLDSWLAWSAKNDYLVLAPEFDRENWREPLGYNFGNIAAGREESNRANPKNKWSFTLVEQIFAAARSGFALRAEKYDLFGHSAGGQFVHRFMLFYPENRARLAIAANPGFYTLPDANEIFPYGLKNSPVEITPKDLLNWTKRNVIIMRGTADVERTESLRQTPEADAQGKNRFERAAFMFAKIKTLNPQTKWRLIDVPNIAHDQKGMARAAQKVLLEK